MSDVQINYSAIIPAFNEVESLGEVIDRAEEVLKCRYDLEIIIIDNGSTDATKLLLEQRIVDSKSNRLRFFRKEINTGYGAGLKLGFQNAKAPILIWTHSDLQCDLWDIARAIDIYELQPSNSRLIVKGARVERPFLDRMFSSSLSLTNRIINNVILEDVNSQPNLIHKNLVSNLNSLPDNSTFELQLLTRAIHSKYSIHRFDVSFPHRKFGVGFNQGLVRKISFSLQCFVDIIMFRFRRADN